MAASIFGFTKVLADIVGFVHAGVYAFDLLLLTM